MWSSKYEGLMVQWLARVALNRKTRVQFPIGPKKFNRLK